MAHPIENTYDATRDPRTGRPILPIDADNTRKADAESLPLTDEDNQGIDIGDDDVAVGEEDDLPQEMEADDAEDDDAAAPSSVDVNATVPRMKAADPESEELESDDELSRRRHSWMKRPWKANGRKPWQSLPRWRATTMASRCGTEPKPPRRTPQSPRTRRKSRTRPHGYCVKAY